MRAAGGRLASGAAHRKRAWAEGTVTALRVQGGHEVDISWANGTVTDLRIRVNGDGPIRMSVGRGMAVSSDGRKIDVETDGRGLLRLEAEGGVTYVLKPNGD